MIADIYELSPIQAGMLFHRVFAPESTAYFDQFSCRLSGTLHADLLCRAWQQLVDRHPVLRTSFHWEGLDKPVQVVHAQATLPWTTLDWRGLSPDLQHARWRDYLEQDRARGFEPDVPPLMRAALVRLTETDYYFCWSHHHLLLDGWCLQLVLSELFARYEALTQGRAPQLAPVRPFSEYIRWLQHRDRGPLERYWREVLHGFEPSPLPIASARRDDPAQSRADALNEHLLEAAVTERLRAQAARHRLTLNTLIQGAWAILISRYTGRDDVAFGATVSGRPPEVAGVESMLGVFINTVPVRVQVDDAARAADWLARVQAQHVARESFAAIPLSDIQKLSGADPATPLFDTNVIVMNYRLDEGLARGAADFEISDVRIFDQTEIPLTLQVTQGDRLSLEIAYDSARFDQDAVTRMLAQVAYVLEQFAQDLERPLALLEIVPPAERSLLLDSFNATDAPLDAGQTAITLWEARVAATPDAIALECDDVRLTYRALNEWANRLAYGLERVAPQGASLGPDTLIAIAFKRSERLVAAILAVWKLRAAYVPIDPDYPAERIRQVLDSASPAIVLRDRGTLDASLEAAFTDRVRFASIDEVEEVARGVEPVNLDRRGTGSDLAYVIFTSGSTGQPKGAMVEQIGMLNHMLAKIEDFHLDSRSIIVQNASHCFDISVWQCFVAMLAGGRTLVYTDALVLDPARFLERMRADRVTVLEVVPSYLAALLDRFELDPRPLDDLQFLMVTGETVKLALVERWFRLFPSIPMANAYGPTEASDDITHAIMREPPQTPTVPVGRPLRNFHIYIVDDRLRLCPIGVAGEVCVSGPGVGRGYLHDPSRTSAVFLVDPFRPQPGVRMYRTGDVGWFTSDGTILLAGRKDYQVKVRGYRIELGDIEAALAGLPMVRDAAVITHRDASDRTSLAAYVSLRDSEATAEQILDALAARLPEYMIPATCTILPALPLTANGKIDRKALPAPDRAVRQAEGVHAAPRSAIEQALADIWSDVLGVERPDIHDNFFAVGGDSILSMQIVSRASRAGFELTPRDIFQHQTIAELALVARPVRPLAPGGGRREFGPAPLTPPQQQFFADVVVDRHHYNQSILVEVPPAFDAERCERALAAVIKHHEALRLRFAQAHGQWQQSVAAAEPEIAVASHDLSDDLPDTRLAAVERIGGELQTGLDFERGPLVGAAYFHFGASEPGRLLIVAHHLAVDGVSWRVLLEDLATAYDGLAEDANVSLPPATAQYLEWAHALAARAPAEQVTREVPRIDVPTDAPFEPSLNTVESGDEITLACDADTTRAFQTVATQVLNSGQTELLIAAFATAYAKWTGGQRLVVDLETHGRDNSAGLDLTRTVGWFTTTTPLVIDLPVAMTDPADVVPIAREAFRQATASPRRKGPRPAILVNYHGRIDHQSLGEWRLSDAAHGEARSPRQQREYIFEINGLISDGQLRITLGFNRHLHKVETVQALAHHLESALVALVAAARSGRATRLLPSDFPAARLDQASLAKLLSRVVDVEDVYELSPTQQGLLFHGLFDQTTDAYFNQLTCAIEGAVEVAAFQEAWRVVVARHPALRTSFHWKDLERPLQIVHRHADIPWTIHDWSELSPGEQARRWDRLGEEDRRHPFDLTTAPLMRCALVRTGPRTHRFRWSQHHLLLDGWSSSIVLADVLAAYDAAVHGRPFAPPAPARFRDHILYLQQQDAAAAEGFWRRELDGFESPTPLVVGLPEMEGRAAPGRIEEAEAVVPGALASRLKALAAANQITLNTLFQGVWSLVLNRYSGDTDVVFGTIVSGRPAALARSDQMVGLFINTVPVRARIDDTMPPFEWLRPLQRANVEREVYSYASLADVQRWSSVAGGTPLFESILIFENYPVAASVADLTHSLAIGDVHAYEPNNYPMTFVVTPGDSIGLKIMFDAGRFDQGTIERTLAHVITLLNGIADAPQAPIGALPLMTATELALMDSWNRTEKPVPAGATVLGVIEAHAREAPDATAVICSGTSVSYGEINARANQLARVLLKTGQLAAEARIVVLLRRSTLLPETILAIWKCGAAYVPADPDYPAERIAAIVSNARAALIIADRGDFDASDVATLPQHAPVVWLDAIAAARAGESSVDLGRPPDSDALAYVIFTSGSTGVPKGAMVEHAGLINHVLSMIDDLSIGPASVVAQTASHCFDISMWQLFAALVARGTTAIYPDALVHRPDQLARRFETDGVSIVQFVPSYLNVFLDTLETTEAAATPRPALQGIAHMVVIGEALTPATVARWFGLYPHVPLMNTYGPTEASDSVTHFDFTQPPGDGMVPIGWPIQNLAAYVVDASMRRCPIGVKGEICIAGVGVGRGYLFDDERTRAVFSQDPFSDAARRLYRTGDIGCYRPDGALLFFGRRDQQVKIRGHRIELGEIESCLSSIEDVRQAVVVSREGSGGVRVLCAYVTANAGRTLSEDQLVDRLSARLPRFAVPDIVRVLPEMPVMPNGKVDRRALAARDIASLSTTALTGPQTPTERSLARIWSEVLGQDDIDIDQSFFDVGGHSLKAIQIVSRLHRDCGVEVNVADVFEHPTIRDLSQLVDATSTRAASGPVPLPPQEVYDTSPMQKRIWLASRTPEGSAGYIMAGAFWLEGVVDVTALRRAFEVLVERHEALRTVFVVVAGSLRQRVRSAAAAGEMFRETNWANEPFDASELDAAIESRLAAPFDMAHGPLFDAELLRLSNSRSLLTVRLHHIVGDADSIGIILREVVALYAAFRQGEAQPPLAPLPVQYRDFVAWQNKLDADGSRERSRQYWLETLAGQLPRSGFIPEKQQPAPSPNATIATCELDVALTLQLRALAARRGTTLFSAVVSAVYALLYRYTQQQELLIGSTVSRRDHPLLEGQIGCYIDTIALLGKATASDTAADLLERTARVCRDALAHRDYPLDSLLNDLRVPAPDGKPPLFDVLVDYLPARGLIATAEQTGLTISERRRVSESAHYDTQFLISESDTGEALALRLVFAAGLLTPEGVEAVRTRLLTILQWLAEDGPTQLGDVNLLALHALPRRRLHVRVVPD